MRFHELLSGSGPDALVESRGQRASVPDIIENLVRQWGADPRAISMSRSYDFALDVCRQFGVGADWVESKNFCKAGDGRTEWDEERISVHWPPCQPTHGLTWDDIRFVVPQHAWVLYNDYHFDAECPEGVTNFFELPRFDRVFSQLASVSKAA